MDHLVRRNASVSWIRSILGDNRIDCSLALRFPSSRRHLVVVSEMESPNYVNIDISKLKNFTSSLILRTGPIVAATRPLVWNKKLKRYVVGHITGSVTNYDGRVTRFSSDEQARRVIADERARWHYYKSFSDRFTPEEWQ
jgi:hypothetical protein